MELTIAVHVPKYEVSAQSHSSEFAFETLCNLYFGTLHDLDCCTLDP